MFHNRFSIYFFHPPEMVGTIKPLFKCEKLNYFLIIDTKCHSCSVSYKEKLNDCFCFLESHVVKLVLMTSFLFPSNIDKLFLFGFRNDYPAMLPSCLDAKAFRIEREISLFFKLGRKSLKSLKSYPDF